MDLLKKKKKKVASPNASSSFGAEFSPGSSFSRPPNAALGSQAAFAPKTAGDDPPQLRVGHQMSQHSTSTRRSLLELMTGGTAWLGHFTTSTNCLTPSRSC